MRNVAKLVSEALGCNILSSNMKEKDQIHFKLFQSLRI